MCRLFGLVAETPVAARYWLLDSPHPFRGWSGYHSHGWGIGWYERGIPELVKEPIAARDSEQFVQASKEAQSQYVICHIRKATCGELTLQNTHPFRHEQWLFGHNGMINGGFFRSLLAEPRQAALAGETDSEVYFHWLLQSIESEGAPGLSRAIREVRKQKFTALNFLLMDGHTLYAYWEQSAAATPPYPDYYQLRYAIRTDRLTGAQQIIVCSERLDDEAWVDIPHSHLLSVASDLNPELRLISSR